MEALRVLLIKEDDTWSAQCLEYDIGAQGDTIEKVTRRFKAVLDAERELSEEETGAPFGGIAPAPDLYHKMWDSADSSLEPESPYADNNTGIKMAIAA